MKVRIGKPGGARIASLACAGALCLGGIVAGGVSAGAATRPMASKKAPLFVDVATATSGQTLASVFNAGSKVQFWIKVFQASTGDTPLAPNALKAVTVYIKGGKSVRATYGKHGNDSFWVATWAIPASYPAGVVSYAVTARADDGATGAYVPFNISASDLTVAG